MAHVSMFWYKGADDIEVRAYKRGAEGAVAEVVLHVGKGLEHVTFFLKSQEELESIMDQLQSAFDNLDLT